MKTKYILIIFLALSCHLTGFSQNLIQLSNYKVGDVIPDVEIKGIHNYKQSTAKISDFKEKLLILDFWATWCSPCVYMIPKMDSLIKAYKGQLTFFSITKEKKDLVEPFLGKLEAKNKVKYNIPQIFEDKELRKLFPHHYLPHYVWIEPSSRKVVAITGYVNVTDENIKRYLSKGDAAPMKTKIDSWLDYKMEEPLLPYLAKNSLAFNNNLTQYSYFTGYINKLKGAMYSTSVLDTSQNRRLVFKNCTRLDFFTYAFGDGRRFLQDESVKMEVKDKEKLTTDLSHEALHNWRKTNTFCYELNIPSKDEKVMFDIMRSDVTNYFREYDVRIEKRKQVCLVLTSIGNNDALRTKGGKWSEAPSQFGFSVRNTTITGLLISWSFKYLSTAKMLVDETNIKFNIDMDLEFSSWKDLPGLNSQLAKYNLKLVEKEVLAEVLVIRDKVEKS